MKNSLIFILIINIFFFGAACADEIVIKANLIQTKELGNIVIGIGNAEAKTNDGFEIYANKFTYNKKKKLLIANGDVKAIDTLKNIKIKSETIKYDELNHKLTSNDFTEINIYNKYFLETSNIHYNTLKKEIFSEFSTKVVDIQNNKMTLQQFKYFGNNATIRGKSIKITDIENNEYFLEDGMINLEENLLIGKDVLINLTAKGFEAPDAEPRLKGNAIYYGNNKTLIKKGIFTSCKRGDKCPPWAIASKEIIHDKRKKEIIYKNAWLKIYDIPVLYFPKFFHPDPSVKRRSGFLKPKFGDSRALGPSINVPYFFALSNDSDLTFKPRIFGTNEFLLQSEYRKVTKNSSHTVDLSYNESKADENKGTKTHFFSKSYFNLDTPSIDEGYINLEIQKTSSDNYLKLYSLNLDGEDSIVKEVDVLESVLEFSASKNEYWLDLSFESFETLGKANSNKYEFIYPSYTLNKTFDFNQTFIENLEFTSAGNQKKHSTNIYEAVQINDFLINGPINISNEGFENDFQVLLKNVNSNGSNSSKYKEKTQSEILSMLLFNMSYPLQKFDDNYFKTLTPRLSVRYSPNDTKNVKESVRYLDTSNIFTLNRIGDAESIEGGGALTLGIDYEKVDTDDNKILGFAVANVFRDKTNDSLSTSSTLGQKQSDIVGEFFYTPFTNFSINYDFSLNNKLDTTNLHKLNTTLKINNFVTRFNFYEENNEIGNKAHYTNEIEYLFDESNSFAFSTRKNKKNNLTEYYNLIYEYKNDCLVASIKYNKEYYENSNTKPFEQLFFNITLIPLGTTQSDSLIKDR